MKDIVVRREGEIFVYSSNVCLSSKHDTYPHNVCIKGVISPEKESCQFGYTPRSKVVEQELEKKFLSQFNHLKPSMLQMVKEKEERKVEALWKAFVVPSNYDDAYS